MRREGERVPTPGRVWLARAIALGADFLQIVALPLFLPGVASPWDDALDVAVAAALTGLVGWHWAFVPSFLAEIVPGLELVPTWTAAAFFVTRRGGGRATRVTPPEAQGAIDAEVVRRSPPEPGDRGATAHRGASGDPQQVKR